MALGNGFLATGSGFTGGGGSGGGGGIGPPGPQGPAGATGPAGPAGATGPPGPTGAEGPIGPQGPVGPVTEIKGSVPTSGDLPTSGNSIGDAYIVEDTGHLWVWNGASFVDAGLIVGPPGPTGSQGPAGATGPQGPAGSTGATGPVGPAGATGASGATGPQGPVGPTGPAGSVDLTNVLAGQCIAVTSPAAGQIQIDAQIGCIQTPWVQPVNANNNALYNVTVVQFTPTGQIYPSSAAGNAMIVWGGTGGVLLRAPVGISISATFAPAYPLDVQGNVNSSGCYLIGGVAYACSDGAGGVALSNITTINGSAPGGGGNPAPPVQSVQWNNSGAFGGSANLIWDNVNTRLGVGTSSPVYPVDIVSAQGYIARINSTGSFSALVIDHNVASGGESVISFRSAGSENALIQYDSDENSVTIWTGPPASLQTTLCCDTNSRVGILTATPAYELDVVGDVNSSGCYRINGNAFACASGSQIALSNIATINGSAPGGGAVASVFGRTGAVVAESGDYNATLITLSPQVSSWTTVQAAISGLNTALSSVVSSQWINGSGGAIYYNGGNVGIGISAPGNKLAVAGDLFLSDATFDNAINITPYAYSAGVAINVRNAGWTTAKSLILNAGGGNVGVGTTNPGGTFEVDTYSGNPAWSLYLLQPGGSWGTVADFNAYRFLATNSGATDGAFRNFHVGAGGVVIGYPNTPVYGSPDALYVNGNVGIGTPTPGMPLDVEAAGGGTPAKFGNANGYMYLGYSDGSKVSIDVENWTLSLESGGAPTLQCSTAHNVTIPNGILSVGSGTSLGNMSPGDMGVSRNSAPTSGVIYFGNANPLAYLYFNGTSWQFQPPLPSSGGGFSNYANQSSNRSPNTDYANSHSTGLFVVVTLGYGVIGSLQINDGGGPSFIGGSSSSAGSISAMVAPGQLVKCTVTFTGWYEYW